jgi:hypothetical protein
LSSPGCANTRLAFAFGSLSIFSATTSAEEERALCNY